MTAGADLEGTDRRWLVLASVLAGTFVGTVNNSVANVAVLDVLADFELQLGAAAWFVTGYVLAFAVLMPVAGRLADAFGTRRVYLGGMAVFLVATVAVALAPTYPVAGAARILQGVANAPVLPTVMLTVAVVFPAGARGRAMGTWAAVNGAAIALGPPVGGWLAEAWGWRAVFWADVPLVGLALLLGLWWLPDVPPASVHPIDVIGGAALTGGLIGAMVALTMGTSWGWTSPTTLTVLALGVALLGWFWRRCHRVRTPFLDLSVLRNRRYGTLSAVAGLQMVALFAVLFGVPMLLVARLGYSVGTAGGVLFVLPLTMVLVGPPLGVLADRHGVRRLLAAGSLLLIGAGLLLALGSAWRELWVVVVGLVVLGAGVAAIQSPSAVGVAAEVGETHRGAAMGLFHTTRFLSGVLGTAGFVTIFSLAAGRSDVASMPDALAGRGFAVSFLVVAAIGLVTQVAARQVPAEELDHPVLEQGAP